MSRVNDPPSEQLQALQLYMRGWKYGAAGHACPNAGNLAPELAAQLPAGYADGRAASVKAFREKQEFLGVSDHEIQMSVLR